MTGAILFFALTCILIELTPGPNMAYLAILAADRGRMAGLAAVAGVATGLALLGVLAIAGLGTVILDNPALYQIVRWAGIGYLLYLAWDAWHSARQPVDTPDNTETGWRYFRRGLVTNLLNPKAALFYVTIMPNFLVEGTRGESYAFGAIYVVIATLIHALIVLLAGSLQPLLTTDSRRRQMGNAFAALLVIVAIWIAVTTRL
jgi:threonine/homoserine/homoserine lactone efflux protein